MTSFNEPRDHCLVSVVIPARNEEALIGDVVRALQRQCSEGSALEILVIDDGSSDRTAEAANAAGARVVQAPSSAAGGNPAMARNHGASIAKGDPLIFLDADCVVTDGWLAAILKAHEAGAVVVAGSLDLPPGLSLTARCDYYCGWYVTHPRRPAGFVPHHPPPNLSVRAKAFRSTSGFSQKPPLDYTNEERAWQAELRRCGQPIYFEPRARAFHHNRPGFGNLLRRNYRWGYTAIESKHETGTARLAWLYRYPRLLIAAALPLAFVHTGYVLLCWVRVGRIEPVLMLPMILVSRFAYALGMAVGGIRWLRYRETGGAGPRPRPRWH